MCAASEVCPSFSLRDASPALKALLDKVGAAVQTLHRDYDLALEASLPDSKDQRRCNVHSVVSPTFIDFAAGLLVRT